MSEFSENYHLRSESPEDAVQLLRRAALPGYVFPPTNGWVSFVVDEGTFEPDERIISAARQALLHFVSAEDHGWGFTLFDAGKVASAYQSAWEDDITSDDSKYSRDALQRLVPGADAALLDEFERRMRPRDFDELLALNRSRLVAQALGLEHYEWLSFNYIASDSPDDHPGVIEVS